ncbi:MAG: hypothetical protein AAF968_26880 [Pseudomonadota bacterium]
MSKRVPISEYLATHRVDDGQIAAFLDHAEGDAAFIANCRCLLDLWQIDHLERTGEQHAEVETREQAYLAFLMAYVRREGLGDIAMDGLRTALMARLRDTGTSDDSSR